MRKTIGVFLTTLVVFLAASSLVLAKVPAEWDKSSLELTDSWHKCNYTWATICNDGDNMTGDSSWQVWFSAEGNPKDGIVVGNGTVVALDGGECVDVSQYVATMGNYMFEAQQREGHPGTGVLWSESVMYDGCHEPEDGGDGEPEVPEFGVLAGGVAVVGSLAVGLFLRRQ